jgi:hypothetical protein
VCDAHPVTCAKVVDLFDACLERFQDFYDSYAACLEAEVEEISLLSFTGPYFLVCYLFISITTALTIAWGLFNEKLFPVKDSTLSLQGSGSKEATWTQTGYKEHIVGSFIYWMVMITMVGIQFLLLTLTIFYYMQQEAVTKWAPVFKDEVQVLKAFIITWMVGIVWCFAYRYPISMHTFFLRRCRLDSATYIAVVAPTKAMKTDQAVGTGDRIADRIWGNVDFVFRTVFSYAYNRSGFETTFCQIKSDKPAVSVVQRMRGLFIKKHCGSNPGGETRFTYHRMRRYVYDDDAGRFIPSFYSVGTLLGDFLGQVGGLSSKEVRERTSLLGPNIIPIDKPTVYGSVMKEFSKPFYLYQNFMVWSWAPYWYYYMCIVNSCVRLVSGVVVAYFQHQSDSVLYTIARVEGEVEYVICLSGLSLFLFAVMMLILFSYGAFTSSCFPESFVMEEE